MDKGPSPETPPTKETPETNKSKHAPPDLERSATPTPDASTNSKNGDVTVKQEPPKQSMPELAPKSTPEPPTNHEAAKEVKSQHEVKPETKSESQSEPVTQKREPEEQVSIDDTKKEDSQKQETKRQEPQATKEQDIQEQQSKNQDTLRDTIKQDSQRQDAPKDSPTLAPPTERQANTSQSNEDFETIQARQQEEIQEYVERIDTLQAKLQYLSKNATEAAKKSKAAAPSGSVEWKLAEKDEKIALLMEEGRKLSTSEQKFRTAIRKLRVQLTDNEKQLDELKKGKEKASAEAEAIRNHMNSNEEQEKLNEEVRKVSAALQKEIDALKKDNVAKDAAYRRLEQDSKANAEQAELASVEARAKALAVERARQKELEDTISSLQKENETLSNKARLDSLEWQEKLDRAVERNRNVEEELKLELLASESKLEAMRATAEEASSGFGGESQIKLIRQIETLQSQYASASDNWQGIEASLLTKVSNLEKERDEAQRRESEMRKKARDSVS